MKITNVILLCLLGLSSVRGDCSEGTLACNSEDKPTICDFLYGYALNEAGDKCEKKTVEGCEIINFEFSESNPCFLCMAGKVMDDEGAICVDVPADNKKDNCSRYDKTSKACTSCDADYYNSGGNCVAVGETKIDNCAVYSAADVCQTCANKYYLKGTECVEIAAVANCYQHTDIKCDGCTNDYVLNTGLNSTVTSIPSNLLADLAGGILNNVTMTSTNSNSVCQKKDVRFCTTFAKYDQCEACNTGYMVTTEKKCIYFPENPIDNCIVYSDKDTCTKCTNATHYVSGNTCTARTSIDNCELYDDNNDKCVKCTTDFYLTSSGATCTERTVKPYKNCAENELDADECKTCNDDHSKVTNQKACLPVLAHCTGANITLGADENALKHTCTQCDDGYTLTDGACDGTPVTNCDDHTENASTCETCDTGFYVNDAKTVCASQNITSCVAYVANENTCTTCANLMKPNVGRTECVALEVATVGKCYLSSGQDDTCTECESTNYIADAKCVNARTQDVNNCLVNISNQDDTKCDTCKDNFFKVTGMKPLQTTANLTTANCVALHSDGECGQCVDNFIRTAGSPRTCTEDSTNPKNCIRQAVGDTTNTNLSETANCEKCNMARGYHSEDGTCIDIHISNLFNCDSMNQEKDAFSFCLDCTDGLSQVEGGGIQCVADSTGGRFPRWDDGGGETNCRFYSSPGVCGKCLDGFLNNAGNCVVPGGNVSYYAFAMGAQGQQIQTFQLHADDIVGDCAVYHQVLPGRVVCTQCDTDFVGIVGELAGYFDDQSTHTFSARAITMNTDGYNHTTYNSFSACIAHDQVVGDTTEAFAHGTSDLPCAAGVVLNGVAGKYACIRCPLGSLGEVAQITVNQNAGTPINIDFWHIKSCANVVSSNYGTANGVGFGLNTSETANSLSLNSLVNVNNCTSGIPLLNLKVESGAALGFKFLMDTNSNDSFQCVTPVEGNYNGVTGAAALVSDSSCLVAVWENTDTSSNASFTSSSKIECIACKPGYKPTYSGILLTGCTAISNCTANNSMDQWNDACSAHLPLEFDVDDPTQIATIDFNTKSTQTGIANCLLQNGTECVMCFGGFHLNADRTACAEPTAADIGCADGQVGIGETTIPLPVDAQTSQMTDSSSNWAKTWMKIYQLRISMLGDFLNYKTHSNPFCHSCLAANAYPMMVPEDKTICGKAGFKAAFTGSNNCKYRIDSKTNITCGVCDDPSTQVLNEDVYSCATNKPNCTYVDSSGNCTLCEPGYFVKNNACETRNCKFLGSTGHCVVCADHSKKDPDNYQQCLAPSTGADQTDCLNYSAIDGKCVKCVAANNVPINIVVDTDLKSFNCVQWTRGISEEGYLDPYTHISSVYTGTTHSATQLADTRSIKGSDFYLHELGNYTDGDKGGENNCIPVVSVDQCATMVAGVRCIACNNGYSLNESMNTCEATTVENCKTSHATDKAKCDECNDTHFLNAQKDTCTTRNKTCKTWEVSADECTSCEGKWLDSSDNDCKAYTVTGCLSNEHRNTDSDNCTQCDPAYYKSGAGSALTCGTYTSVTNCLTYHPTLDKCFDCKEGYYLVTPESGAQSCEELTTVDFCTDYQTDSDACSACEGDRYLNTTTNECRDYPKGTANCMTYEYPDKCVECETSHYLSGTACVALDTPLAGCSVHSSATACKTCQSTHFLDGSECTTITAITGCKEYSAADKCKTCEGKYYLENESCVDSGITGCIDPVKGDPNTCNTCDDSKYLSEDKRTCSTGTAVSGCAKYKSQTVCEKCSSGKVLSADGTSCSTLGEKGGAQCDVASTSASAMCDICQYGFKKAEDGSCTAISSTDCVLENSEGKCLICMPNSTMDKDGKCTKKEVEECDPETDENCISTTILKMAFTFFLAFFLVRFF